MFILMLMLTLMLSGLANADGPQLAYRGDVLALRDTLIACRTRARSAAEKIVCFRRSTPDLIKILNEYYDERKAHLGPERVARLDRAQAIWELFRDHECDDSNARTDEELLESHRCHWDEAHARLYEIEKRTRVYDW